ncbi:MAG: hypothetical protein MI794_16140 [Pseudomonadales bacterium]|nr:hypothetical protein [Pseudomonadales bacterium]
MIEGSSSKNDGGRPGWGTWLYSKREAVWYVLIFIIPYLTFRIFISTGEAVEEFNATGQFNYPEGYVTVASITLLLCGLVPFLLKDSEPDLRLGGIILTSIAPGVVTAMAWHGMLRSVEHEQHDEKKNSIHHYFFSQHAYYFYRTQYQNMENHKAMAQSRMGAWSWAGDQKTAMKAAEIALLKCMDDNEQYESEYPCDIIVLNDEWIQPE